MTNQGIQNKSGCKYAFQIILFVLSIISALTGLLFLLIAVLGGAPQFTGYLIALFLILPFLITLIVRIKRMPKVLRQFDKKSKGMLSIVLILTVVLVVSLTYILAFRQEFTIKVESGAILNGVKFIGSDFSGKDLSNASFRDTDLSNVNFSNANLTGVDFSGSKMIGSNLTNAALSNTIFDSTNLTGLKGLSDEQFAQAINIPFGDLFAVTAHKQIIFEDRSQMHQTLSVVCNQGVVKGAHQYNPENPFHTIVILDSEGKTSNFTDKAANNHWESTAIRFTDLVACMSEEMKEVIEVCQYKEGLEISRVARVRNLRVIVAQTGEILFDSDLYYQLPRECPIYSSKGQPDIRGWGPGEKQMLEEIERFVKTGKE